MSRTKGALNRPKRKPNEIITINLEKQIQGAPITKENTMYNIANYGERNDYPQKLLELYQNSPTHHSCVQFAVRSIIGEGVDTEAMFQEGNQVMPSYQTTWDELIENLALDFIIFGSYAVEVILNRDRKSYSFYHIPYEKVRWHTYDSDGTIPSYFVSNDWSRPVENPPIEIESIEMTDDDKIQYGKPYMYVYKKYSPTQSYYCSPNYAASIKAIQSEIEFCNYDLKHIVNSFTVPGLLTLPPVDDENERQAIISNITKMFNGSENANALMLQFSNGLDNMNANFTPFASDNTADIYEQSNERCISRIMEAHNIPSRLLIGLPDGNSGFNSESALLESAYNLYNKLVGNSNRRAIVKTLNQMLKMQGVDVEIKMKPLTFLDDVEESGTDNDAVENNANTDEDNIEEVVS